MRKLLLSIMLMSALIGESWAQDRTVSGKVTSNEDGSTLPGVTVILKGTTNGTTSDLDGNWKLSIPQEGGTLVFSFVGMSSQEIEVGTRSVIDLGMATDAQQLAEIVVTAQGIERDVRSLGYSASQVNSEEVTRGRTTDVMSSLQGKVAGVNITTASGAPGASTKVILRGYSSIGGANNPLYIVDGVPINNSSNNFNDSNGSSATGLATDVNRSQDFGNRANDINPDDVESVTILKGASATALYGSRAANGVIVITTKKGKSQEGVKLSFSSSATFSRPLRLPQLQDTFGQGWSGHYASEENGSWGPRLDGQERLHGNVVDNSQQLRTFEARDNLKDFYETGTSYINTISLSGGNDLATYYLSYGNVKEDGIVPGDADQLNRNSISLRGTLKGEKLSTTTSLNYSNKKQSVITSGQGGAGTTTFQELIQVPRDASIVDWRDYNNPFNNLDNFHTQYAQNPYYSINENGNSFNEDRVYGKIDLTYKFNDWLNATYRIGADVANSHLKDWIAIANTTPGSPNGTVTDIPGQVIDQSRYAREIDHTFMVNAYKTVTSDLSISGLVGLNNNERVLRNQTQTVAGLDIPGYYNISNSSSNPVVTTFDSKRRLIGVYGQLEASYKDMLFVTAVARNDWSSTLPKDNNSFFYPGVNMSFVFSEVTPFLDGILSFGKVRASWGQTGNDAAPYAVESVLIPGQVGLPFGNINLPFNGVNGFEVSNIIGNPALQPEITSEWEIGADLKFFNNRFGIDVAYYDRSTTDQILRVSVPVSSGYTQQTKNIGEVTNKGVELMITATPIKTANFSWDISYNYTKNKNEVVSLTDGLEFLVLHSAFGIEMRAEPGKPMGAIYGHTEATAPTGEVIVNGAGIPTVATDKVYYGDVNPDFTMGLANAFKYKNFRLNVNLDYREGGMMYSYTQRLTMFVGNATNTLFNERRPWIVPNSVVDNGDGTFSENTQAVDYSNVNNFHNQSSNNSVSRQHMHSKTFLKLREVSLGYSFPKALLDKTPIASLDLNIVGRNLLLFTPESNNLVDPESTTFGNDLLGEFGEFGVGPTTRSLGFSLKATF
ncbi:MAG: SusC/RagA family TonB-linked outer membrane protein [Reichenbachiella sp.]|uniref:SusC/RagA family TonB-linked outer membrane protein n=2 Tax=Reichenbachiella sp. TaxID=2184521 RepID=UPI0032660FB6